MSVQLNHTIVWCSDQQRSAAFLADIFGLPAPTMFSHFHVVQAANGVSLDFAQQEGRIARQHYAFLVSETEFDAIMERIKSRGLDFWADPTMTRAGEINRLFGGRGVYFKDPDGHVLEAITAPYSDNDDD